MDLQSETPISPKLRGASAWIAGVAIGLLVIGGGFLLYHVEPNATSWYPKCPLHQMTGLHCPGCGITRSASALVHGDLATAVRMNPLAVLGGPILVILLWRRGRQPSADKPTGPALGQILLVVLVVYFVARNVPSPSRSWLAPPERDASAVETPVAG
ncbi:hypothetical protein Poly24_34560 [Rosistilla carotiformis]|uniref:DUF2752 domain-containing protein n=1 Tax=Rosistilla carotiformis TaxID=2528017 RepID=A0A518JW22_9BACT|nr:DUF2752 domain-containing protein [Rosistilla carotiformis]QDV69739.1 hypothetical protein Poly24_34560 [Rosistilla carotiformis]